MNGCDYNNLIKGRVMHGIIILCVLFHITTATETAECAFLNGFMVLVFYF